jgi:hypothetical protein
LHFTNQNTTTISFTVYHCIAYYFSLHIPASTSRHKRFFWRRCICIFIYFVLHISVLYTYTHLLLDNHLVRLRAQSNFILPCRLLEEGQEGSLYT